MKRALLAIVMCGILGSHVAAEEKTNKLQEVKMGDIKLKVPATWKKEKPSSNLRLGQFSVPAVKGDKLPAELSVFFFGGTSGTVNQNIQRWVGQFAPAGRKIGVIQGKSTQGDYHTATIIGTYNRPIGPPFQRRTKPTANSRMIAVILQVKDRGAYYLKLTGPDKTVTAAAEALRASFGGDKKSEKKAEF